MQIFLDTNIIFKEHFFRSTNARALLKAARFLGLDIVIPEIVVDEVKGNFSSEFAEKLAQYEKAYRELRKLIKFDEIHVSFDDEVAEYAQWLDDHLEEKLPSPISPSVSSAVAA